MRAIFVRHGESTGNVGIAAEDLALIELTETGWQQAREVATSWTETPTLIMTSPYLRAQQTAVPTIERFPSVPVEVWPIQEFTYLSPETWNGTPRSTRLPHIERYWQAADPDWTDGPGTESFRALLVRAERALLRLSELPGDALVYLFSHGQFMQAVRMSVELPEVSAREKMQHFWRRDGLPAIGNAEGFEIMYDGQGWSATAVLPIKLSRP